MKGRKRALAAVLMLLITASLFGCTQNQSDGGETDTMFSDSLIQTDDLFSFQYGRQKSSEFLKDWNKEQTSKSAEGYTLCTTVYSDPDTGLKITLETKKYTQHKATEWVARLENTGSQNTPVIEDFYIADFRIGNFTKATDPLTVAYSKGSDVKADDFLFMEKTLSRFGSVRLSATGGRSTSCDCMPYFNLHTQTKGYLLAVGWTGQWQMVFKREASGAVRVTAGMEQTHFVLYPGESVRTPSFTVLEWEGTETDSYNAWRAFILDYHTPKTESGAVVTLPITCGTWGGDPASGHLNLIKALSEAGADYDAYWIDAGWFGSADRHSMDQYGNEWFKNAGDWFHNTLLYPDGLAPISQAAEAAGYDFLLWFEPERAWCESLLVQEHPEWFLITQKENSSYLFNMGNEEARVWMTNFISGKIQEYGVDIYRQDFNTDALPYWQAYDTEDRQGITEMKYIEGLYAYLDALLEQNPGLIMDNCAGGGRRLDYEMLTRALPFWRSDYQCFTTYETTPCQVQTDGLSRWVPLSGTGVQSRPLDTYSFRSNLAYAVQFPPDLGDREWHSRMIADFHQAQPYFLGDYYCLTDGDITANDTWYAYQMHREDLSEGFILAFRRENAAQSVMTLSVYLPEEGAKIQFTDADTGKTWTETLTRTEDGFGEFILQIGNPRESRLLFYKIIA